MFQMYNKNPYGNFTDDCTVRAIATVMDEEWDDVWLDIMVIAFKTKTMMSSNSTWQEYLRQKGFIRYNIPDKCPNCYTIKDFAKDFQNGSYIVGTGTHVVAVIDGNYYDTGDSGNEVPIYYWKRG